MGDSSTPRTDREVYTVSGADAGFEVVNPALCRTLERELAVAQRALHVNLDAAIAAELERAIAKFPTWPTDPLHALAVLGEEFGELTKEMLQLTYEPHKTNAEEVRKEALQTAAMALRLYRSLDVYEYKPGPQHAQR